MARQGGNVAGLRILLVLLTTGVLTTGCANPVEEMRERVFALGDTRLKTALQQVNDLQLHAADQVERLVAGEQVDLHEVMISSEEAAIAFELMLEIRNKLVEAYQELQRMHV